MSGLSKSEHIAKAAELSSLGFGKFFPERSLGRLKLIPHLMALTRNSTYAYVPLFTLPTPLAQSLQKFSRLCEETGTENEMELKELRIILTYDSTLQTNKAHVTVSGSEVLALSKPVLTSENHSPFIKLKSDSFDKVQPVHSNIDHPCELIGFRSELKNGAKPDDDNNDAPNYAFFRLIPENRGAQFLRVAPEFQPF